jgi:hypothetical protein
MTLHSLFPEENPFTHIKARQIFLCYFLVTIVLIVLVYSLIYSFLYYYNYLFDIDYQRIIQDPIIPSLIFLLILGLANTWVVRKLKLIQIQPKAIIGRLPIHFNWLPIIGIVLTRRVFSFGAFLVLYYPISFIFPSLIENYFSGNSFNFAESQSFSPVFDYIFHEAALLTSSLNEVFILEGIVLHIWAAKGGIKSALIMLSIVYLIQNPVNFIGGISLCLMLSFLYIKTKTLIVPIVASFLNQIVGSALFEVISLSNNPLENFRSQFGIGIFCLAISTPLLIWLLYKNRIRPNEQMPYFANLQQLRSNE